MLKGFSVAKKYEHVYVKMRLDDNLAFFESQRGDLEVSAQILIAYHWRKKLMNIRRKRLEELKKEKDESPPKGVQSKVKPYIDGKVNYGSFRRGMTKNKGSFSTSKTSLFKGDRKSNAPNTL